MMVPGLSWCYVRFGGLSWIHGAFDGIGAWVIAIIALSAYKLVKKTFERDWLFWFLGMVSAAVTVWTESEILWIFIAAGEMAVLLKAPPKLNRTKAMEMATPLVIFFIFLKLELLYLAAALRWCPSSMEEWSKIINGSANASLSTPLPWEPLVEPR